MLRSGVSPDEIEWRVGKDGSFAFGRKQEGPPLTYEQASKLLSWARKGRIKVAFIGWEEAQH